MLQLRKITHLLRKALLVGWAMAVIWIYVGNLVNFHLHKIWGKQLIPVACTSTRDKGKESSAFIKNAGNTKAYSTGLQFYFGIPDQRESLNFLVLSPSSFVLTDITVFRQETTALSFRGPPSA